jgi:large subunit ribosomal protein L25
MSIVLKSEKRVGFGKNASRRLRRQGFIPAVLYGGSTESTPLVLNKKDIIQIMKLESGENTIFTVAFDTEEHNAMIKDLQIDPATDEIYHADLILIAMDKVIRVTVPIEHVGSPVGVKTEGGFIDFVTREVEVECLPKDIPENIEIDISDLHINQSFKVEHIEASPGVELITDPGQVLVLISVPHKEEEEFPGETPEEDIAEEEEPEVIKKERAEKEPEKEAEQEKPKEEK